MKLIFDRVYFKNFHFIQTKAIFIIFWIKSLTLYVALSAKNVSKSWKINNTIKIQFLKFMSEKWLKFINC